MGQTLCLELGAGGAGDGVSQTRHDPCTQSPQFKMYGWEWQTNKSMIRVEYVFLNVIDLSSNLCLANHKYVILDKFLNSESHFLWL